MKKAVQVLESRKSANNDFPGKVKHRLPYYNKLIKAELKSYPWGYALTPGDNISKYT